MLNLLFGKLGLIHEDLWIDAYRAIWLRFPCDFPCDFGKWRKWIFWKHKKTWSKAHSTTFLLVHPEGVEPSTSGAEIQRSIQLSYGCILKRTANIVFWPNHRYLVVTFSLVKKKECPSCAMEIDRDEKVCPICQYEFPQQSQINVWVAIGLVILFLLFLFHSLLQLNTSTKPNIHPSTTFNLFTCKLLRSVTGSTCCAL